MLEPTGQLRRVVSLLAAVLGDSSYFDILATCYTLSLSYSNAVKVYRKIGEEVKGDHEESGEG